MAQAEGAQLGRRAMVPSSFITSQITPPGRSPVSRAKSTAASVWPVRTSTPPLLDRIGKTCPGRARSSGRESGWIATWTVLLCQRRRCRRHALRGVDGFAEGGTELRRVVAGHQWQLEAIADLRRQRQTDQATPVQVP